MFDDARHELVRRLRLMGYVKDERVLAAMDKVPRHEFLPDESKQYAYHDTPLSIGKGQTISAPHMVGIMLEALHLGPGMKVLEIGTGSGYHASLLGELVRPGGKVYTVERIEELGLKARTTLERLGYGDTVEVVISDGTKGLPEHAPYDRVLVTAAAPYVPEPLKEQLAEGGTLLIPVGDRPVQDLLLVTKKEGKYEERPMGEVVFVPLIGQYGYRD
jgi:protein-L-isoaspartate(D-aspartate) O-methyltransferase